MVRAVDGDEEKGLDAEAPAPALRPLAAGLLVTLQVVGAVGAAGMGARVDEPVLAADRRVRGSSAPRSALATASPDDGVRLCPRLWRGR